MTYLDELINRANQAYYTENFDDALKLYEQVLELEPGNKVALEKIQKASRNRLATTKDEDIPSEALELYKRSRSFIAANDLAGAKELLEKAIDIAHKESKNFTSAKELLRNIHNALKAGKIKKMAFEELEAQQWIKASENLKNAKDLDPTDIVAATLYEHLQLLIKARSSIEILRAGGNRNNAKVDLRKEIQRTIEITNITTPLSKLWQDVVRSFGEYNKYYFISNTFYAVLSAIAVSVLTFWFLYLYPRHREIKVQCDLVAQGLIAKLSYPYYVADGDDEEIEILFNNTSATNFNGLITVDFKGSAKILYSDPTNSNIIRIEDLLAGGEKQESLQFHVEGSKVPGPWYIHFTLDDCVPEPPYNSSDLYIAMTPIPNLRSILLWIVTGSGTTTFILTLFRQSIFDFILRKNIGK